MTRFIVVLGTTSHSGKSTLVAALCRLLSDRGFRVAPFKSQNMSLNSWVTRSGAEIGIAQAVPGTGGKNGAERVHESHPSQAQRVTGHRRS